MSSTPTNSRSSTYPPGGPFPRNPRFTFKTPKPYESGLSLTRVIGTTVASPVAFDNLVSSSIFAYTAGAAAVVVKLDDDCNISQRFFRARPAAGTATLASNNTPTASTGSAGGDGRSRAPGSFRESGVPFNPSTPEGLDSPKESRTRGRTKDSIKAATCISLSRDGKLLAVGETGYAPRVLVFSLQDGSSDMPLTSITGHDHGVRAVAFSPDQRYLASLGEQQDGYLYVSAMNQRTGVAKLHSTGKCTTLIQQMVWVGNALVTIGTRHIKIWKVDEPQSTSPKKPKFALDGTPQPQVIVPPAGSKRPLPGRNVILGDLSESKFTCIAAISDCKALVCSEKGDVCLLEDCEDRKLMKVANAGFPITCITIDTKERLVRIAGLGGRTKALSLDQLLSPSTPPESPDSLETEVVKPLEAHINAMGYAAESLVTIDSQNLIAIHTPGLNSSQRLCTLPAHGASVNGVRLLPQPNVIKANFLTWSADGTVMFWDLNGDSKLTIQVDLGDEENQCLVVRPIRGGRFLVTGDKHGVIRIINTSSYICVSSHRAHQSDVQDIALYESHDETLMASCGRDMTVQLFRFVGDECSHVQTLNDHTASVTGVLFADDGKKLISCSMNRDIQVRQIVRVVEEEVKKVAALPQKVIMLKAAPISMSACLGEQSGNLVVSMTDRSIGTFELANGRLVSSFGAAQDSDNKDTIIMSALFMGTPSAGNPTILAGVSSTDKSVRIYDGISGSFLDRDYGHSAAVKDVALLETPNSDKKTLISTGSDGCIMIWDLSSKPKWTDIMNAPDGDPQSKDTPSIRPPPLRRVLSKADLAEFQRQSPTPTGSRSPPRAIRRKTSRYGLSSQQSPTLGVPPIPMASSKHFISSSDDQAVRRKNARNRSRSPQSLRVKDMRRPSLASLNDASKDRKSTGNFSEYGSLGNTTETICRTLQNYRRKLKAGEPVKDESLRELDYELRATIMALGERNKSKTMNEAVLTDLLDQYSEKLVSMFSEKLQLSKLDSNEEVSPETPRPRTAGNPSTTVSTPV